ncbi:MAG: hypothetical protein AAGA62_12940, partial [Bacteroidota bacterium]
MARSTTGSLLPPETFEAYAREWQRCRTEDLPNLFYAYDAKDNQTERIATFFMDTDQLALVARLAEQAGDDLQFFVHLGLTVPPAEAQFAPEYPHFT